MSDNLESTQSVQETQGVTSPTSSEQPEGKPTSDGQIDAIVSAILERPELADEIDRRVQSVKDKRFNRLEREQQTQKDQLDRFAELLEQGKSVTEAKQQLQVEDDLAYIRELRQKQSSQMESKVTVPDVSEAYRSISSKFGVGLDDPGVRDWIANNPDADAGDFALYVANRKTSTPPASPAGISAPSGGTAPTGEYAKYSDDDLGAELEHLSYNDPKNPERKKIAAELKRRDKAKK